MSESLGITIRGISRDFLAHASRVAILMIYDINGTQEGQTMYSLHFTTLVLYFAVSKIETSLVQKSNRPIRLTQCCTQFKSPGDKILCVLYLHYNVAFTFK